MDDVDKTRLLLRRGADVNARSDDRQRVRRPGTLPADGDAGNARIFSLAEYAVDGDGGSAEPVTEEAWDSKLRFAPSGVVVGHQSKT